MYWSHILEPWPLSPEKQPTRACGAVTTGLNLWSPGGRTWRLLMRFICHTALSAWVNWTWCQVPKPLWTLWAQSSCKRPHGRTSRPTEPERFVPILCFGSLCHFVFLVIQISHFVAVFFLLPVSLWLFCVSLWSFFFPSSLRGGPSDLLTLWPPGPVH